MNVYEVVGWNEHYENNRSRLVKELSWVPVPNGHDGEGYSRLISGKDAAVVFAAWILILQVASRCQPRGRLVRSNHQPHDFESLAMKTRAPAAWFEKAVPVLTQIGWIEVNPMDDNGMAPPRQDAVTAPSPDCQHGDEEQKGKKGREGNEGKRAPTLPEWLEHASVEHPDWPARDAQNAWNHYESQSWMRGKTKITKWRACVATCYQHWQGEHPANVYRPHEPAPKRSIGEPEGWREWLVKNRSDSPLIQEPSWEAIERTSQDYIVREMGAAQPPTDLPFSPIVK